MEHGASACLEPVLFSFSAQFPRCLQVEQGLGNPAVRVAGSLAEMPRNPSAVQVSGIGVADVPSARI